MVSSISPIAIELFNHLDMVVYMVQQIKGKKTIHYLMDNKAHIFLDEKGTFRKFKKEIEKVSNKKLIVKETAMCDALMCVIESGYDGVFLHDIMNDNKNICSEIYISTEDLRCNISAILITKCLREASINEGNIFMMLSKMMDCSVTAFVDRNNPIYHQKADANSDRLVFSVFTTEEGLESYAKQNNFKNVAAERTTIRNVLRSLPSGIGLMIDPGSGHGATIERELFEETILKTFNHTKNRHYIKERLEYYKNIDNYFIPLYPLCDFDSRIGFSLREIAVKNNEAVGTIVVSESYENAKKYVDAHCVKLVDDAPPVGIANKEVLKNILMEYGVEYIKLDAETVGECMVSAETFYEMIYGEKLMKKASDAPPIPIPMKNQEFDNPLDDKMVDEINNMSDIQILKKLPKMNIHMLLKTAEIYVNRIIKQKNDGTDTAYIENIYKLVLYLLLFKMDRNKYSYIVIDLKTGNPLKHSSGAICTLIDGRYANNHNELYTIELCDETMKEFAEANNFVLCTNNKNAGLLINVQMAIQTLKAIREDEKAYSDFLIYMIEKCGFSYNQSDFFYIILLCHSELRKEFAECMESNGNNWGNSSFRYNKKSVAEYAEDGETKEETYFRIANMLT